MQDTLYNMEVRLSLLCLISSSLRAAYNPIHRALVKSLDSSRKSLYNHHKVTCLCYFMQFIVLSLSRFVNRFVTDYSKYTQVCAFSRKEKRRFRCADITIMLFKDKVKEHRGRLGLTQKELAERSGIGFRTITSYESGERFPHAAQLYKLAQALGVSTEYLKDDTLEDPSYGLDRMDYVEEMRSTAGTQDALDLEVMLRQNQALFAGGQISEEAKDAYFRAVMKAYYECKEGASITYSRKSDSSKN